MKASIVDNNKTRKQIGVKLGVSRLGLFVCVIFVLCAGLIHTSGSEYRRVSFQANQPLPIFLDPLGEQLPSGQTLSAPFAASPVGGNVVFHKFVNTSDGSMNFSIPLLHLQKGFPIELQATFSSAAAAGVQPIGPWELTDLEAPWVLSYSDSIIDEGNTGPAGEHRLTLLDDRGSSVSFLETTTGEYSPEAPSSTPHKSITWVDAQTLTENYDGGITKTYTVTSPGSGRWRLVGLQDERGDGLTITYTSGLATRIENNVGVFVDLVRPIGQPGAFAPDRVHSLNTSSGLVSRFVYDTVDETLSTMENVVGHHYYFTYVGSPAQVSTVEEDSIDLISIAFDGLGRVGSIVTPSGSTSYDYVSVAQATVVTDPLGFSWTFQYDSAGWTTQVDDPLGYCISRAFDLDGNVQTLTDPNDNVWSYTYDLNGNQTREVGPLGGHTLYTYDSESRLLSFQTRRGATTTFDYDTQGRLIRETDPTGVVHEISYDLNGRIETFGTPGATTVTRQYDTFGEVVGYTDSSGYHLSLTRDDLGRIVSVTRPDGFSTLRSYNFFNLVQVQASSGDLVSFSTNLRGRIIDTTTPAGEVFARDYDDSGRLISATDPLGRTANYAYDAADQLVSIVDPAGGTRVFTYDGRGLLTSAVDPLGRVTTYAYDARRNPIAKVWPNGNTVTWAYDLLGRPISRTLPNGGLETFSYDLDGNLIEASGPDATEQYSYDLANRLKAATRLNAGWIVQYEYDAFGRRSAMLFPNGESVGYSYDSAGRLTTVTTPEGSQSFVYNALSGLLETVTDPNGTTLTYAYDANGRVTHRELRDASNQPISIVDLTLDANGRPTIIDDSVEGMRFLTYDTAGQIKSVVANGVTTLLWYDSRGNRVKVRTVAAITVRTYDAANQVLSVTITPPGETHNFVTDDVADLSASQIITRTGSDGSSRIYRVDYSGRVYSKTINGDATFQYEYLPGTGGVQAGLEIDTTTGDHSEYIFLYDEGRPLAQLGAPAEIHNLIYTGFGRISSQRAGRRGVRVTDVALDWFAPGSVRAYGARPTWAAPTGLSQLLPIAEDFLFVRRLVKYAESPGGALFSDVRLPALVGNPSLDPVAGRSLTGWRAAGSVFRTTEQNPFAFPVVIGTIDHGPPTSYRWFAIVFGGACDDLSDSFGGVGVNHGSSNCEMLPDDPVCNWDCWAYDGPDTGGGPPGPGIEFPSPPCLITINGPSSRAIGQPGTYTITPVPLTNCPVVGTITWGATDFPSSTTDRNGNVTYTWITQTLKTVTASLSGSPTATKGVLVSVPCEINSIVVTPNSPEIGEPVLITASTVHTPAAVDPWNFSFVQACPASQSGALPVFMTRFTNNGTQAGSVGLNCEGSIHVPVHSVQVNVSSCSIPISGPPTACAGTSVPLTASPNFGLTPVAGTGLWSAPGADVTTGNGSTFSAMYSTPGDRIVSYSGGGVVIPGCDGGATGVCSQISIHLIEVGSPPFINIQPQHVTVPLGDDAQFFVDALGSDLTYEWFKDGQALFGSNSPFLTLPSVTVSDAGAQILVRVTNSCGIAVSLPATLTVERDVVVITWVDRSPIDLPALESQASLMLVDALDDTINCWNTLLDWEDGDHTLIFNEADRRYANAFLVYRTDNANPPPVIDPDAELMAGDFRMFNRFKVTISGNGGIPEITSVITEVEVGMTRNPCGSGPSAPGVAHLQNGNGVRPSGNVFQLNESRIGPIGQAIDHTINACELNPFAFVCNNMDEVGETTPWIWSVIMFNPDGSLRPIERQMFPAYTVYEDGILVETIPQGDLETFIALDETSQIQVVDLP